MAIPQRVLVVGGAGQMGEWLCRYFRSRGREVVVNDPAGAPEGYVREPDLEAGGPRAPVGAGPFPESVLGGGGPWVPGFPPVCGPSLGPLASGNITFSDCGNGVAVLEAKELFRPSGASFVDVSLDHHDEFMAFLLSLSHMCLLTFARTLSRSP